MPQNLEPTGVAPPPGSTSAHGLPKPLGSLRMLVVEDSETDYELMRAIVRRAGWSVACERVEERAALEHALSSERWDIVVSDYSLPRFSGREALEITRETADEIPFILVSGAIGEDAAVAALHAGADDCINKDNLARLPPAIERSLASAESRRERRRAERALGDSLERMTALVNASPLAIVALDLAGAVTLWNPAAERMFGWPAAQVRGRPLPDFGEHREGDDQRILERVLAGDTAEVETRRHRADGTLLEVSVSAAALHEDKGQVIGCIVMIADISDRKRSERELHESREELRALSAHMDKAIESERTRIARELHDQVGGTLTALRSELDVLRERVGADADVARRIASMDRLVDTAVSASISVSHALRPSMLDYGIFPALEWQASEFAERSGIGCRLSCNEEELTLDIEQSTALFRICQEALTNVAKHAAAQSVVIELFATGAAVTLEVRDDGCGLAQRALEKSDSFGVRGMLERVRALGGWLDISGQAGRGTTLMLSIPRRRAKPERTES